MMSDGVPAEPPMTMRIMLDGWNCANAGKDDATVMTASGNANRVRRASSISPAFELSPAIATCVRRVVMITPAAA